MCKIFHALRTLMSPCDSPTSSDTKKVIYTNFCLHIRNHKLNQFNTAKTQNAVQQKKHVCCAGCLFNSCLHQNCSRSWKLSPAKGL